MILLALHSVHLPGSDSRSGRGEPVILDDLLMICVERPEQNCFIDPATCRSSCLSSPFLSESSSF